MIHLAKEERLSEAAFQATEQCLQEAESNYENDQSDWGLGLTYNLLGRIYRYKQEDSENFTRAKRYYVKAVEAFSRIDHYGGIYLSLKDLHDL